MCSLGCSSNVSKAVTTTEKIMKTHEVFSSTTPFDVDLDIFLHVKCFFEVIFKTYTCICLFSTLAPIGNVFKPALVFVSRSAVSEPSASFSIAPSGSACYDYTSVNGEKFKVSVIIVPVL